MPAPSLYVTRIRRKTNTTVTTLTDQEIDDLWDEGTGELPGKSNRTISAWIVHEYWLNKSAEFYSDVDVKMGDISEKLSQRLGNIERLIKQAEKELTDSINKDVGILISSGNASRRRPIIEYEMPDDRTGRLTDDESKEDVP